MDPAPDRSDPGLPQETGTRSPGHWKLGLGLFAIILLGAIFIITSTASRNQKLAWLPPSVLSRAMQPTLFTRLKYNLVRLTAPLWRWHRSRRPNIRVNAKLVELPSLAAFQATLGPATATNADGTRAWILPPEAFSSVKQKFLGDSGTIVQTTSEASITVYSGGPARATLGPGAMYNPVNGSPIPLGLTVDVVPSLAGHSIRMIVGATYMRLTSSAGSGITTNFSAACRVLIPNGGGLIIESAGTNTASATNYLFLVSPTVIDSRGNPVKL